MSKQLPTIITFACIGLVNTVVDVGIFVLLHDRWVLPLILANFVSTSIALLCSFYLNNRFTFRASKTNSRKFLNYTLITLTGLWLLQPLLITLFIQTQNSFNYLVLLHSATGMSTESLFGVVPKLLATIFTAIWNYVLYSKYAFTSTLSTK